MTTKTQWRVGRRSGQSRWQVKCAPGWRVAHECDTLAEAAAWLVAQGIDIAGVPVCSLSYPWPMLNAYVMTERIGPAGSALNGGQHE